MIRKFAFSEKKFVSLPFLGRIFNFLSFIPKKQTHLPYVLEKKKVSCYVPLRVDQVTKLALKELNCAQRITEFKVAQ